MDGTATKDVPKTRGHLVALASRSVGRRSSLDHLISQPTPEPIAPTIRAGDRFQ
jgi:hypothetical protein